MRIVKKTKEFIVTVNSNGCHQRIKLDELDEYIRKLVASKRIAPGTVDGRRGECLCSKP
jgi:hypothetical protein